MSSKFMDSAKIHHIKFSKSIVWNTFPIYVLSNSFQMQAPTSQLHVRNIDKGRSVLGRGVPGFEIEFLCVRLSYKNWVASYPIVPLDFSLVSPTKFAGYHRNVEDSQFDEVAVL